MMLSAQRDTCRRIVVPGFKVMSLQAGHDRASRAVNLCSTARPPRDHDTPPEPGLCAAVPVGRPVPGRMALWTIRGAPDTARRVNDRHPTP